MKSYSILGMRLDYITPQEGIVAVIERIKAGQGGYCCVPNVHMCIETIDDPSFKKIINQATLNWSDSTILQKACALRHGQPMLPVFKGADIMPALLEKAAHEGIVAGLYGASEKTISLLQKSLPERFPGLKLDYAFSPPFRILKEAEDQAIIKDIDKAGVQLLFIGLGCPKQEKWMAEHTKALPNTLMIGIGAAFDFNAGTVKPSPDWVHRVGLEWLYRLIQEPKRLAKRYLTTNPRFLMLLGWDMIKSRLFNRKTS